MFTNATTAEESTGLTSSAAIESRADTDDVPEWEGPFTEHDKNGAPTGAAYVRCPECSIEVLTGSKNLAAHRDGCSYGN